MNRREFVAALTAPALVGLTRKAPRRIVGGFVDDGGATGHRLRDGSIRPFSGGEIRRVPIVIVGGGIAGLCAAWELQRKGVHDFVVLEMERTAGGNSRYGVNDFTAFPWAAHYVPMPDRSATLVRELFTDLGVLRDGVWEETYLCFSPQERLFQHGEWHDGVVPEYAMTATDRGQMARFNEEIAAIRATNQFTIPVARGARQGSPLDRVTMGAWMRDRGFSSAPLRWYVDYACRDDFGAAADDVSAWAGVHYFAARGGVSKDPEGPLTWSAGNGWIAEQLTRRCERQLITGEPVVRIEREARGKRWSVRTPSRAFLADAVIFAAPTFLAPKIVAELEGRAVPRVYSPWLTANLVLHRWPKERGRGVGVAWDNVMYDSPSLGYVVATHQSLATHADRTVWTYYWALSDRSPSEGRRLLQQRSWAEWRDAILDDLARAHPDIRECVSRVDMMRMGHAMVRPSVGMLRAGEEMSKLDLPGLYFGNSDLSGVSLFEEAQYRGVMAARRAMKRLT